jgi:predicted XRE-type DNA-binding protein
VYFYAEVRFSLDRGSAERSEGTRMSKTFGKLLADRWELGSDNTFADLGLVDAAEMKARTYLRAMIIARIENLRLTQSDVSRRTRLTQPKVSKLISDATAAGFSSAKLMKIGNGTIFLTPAARLS